MKRLTLSIAAGLSFLLVGCSEHPPTEEIYEQAISQTEQLETVQFQRNQTLRAQQDSFRGQLLGGVQYDPQRFYGELEMELLNLNESLKMKMYLDEENWQVRQDQEDTEWEDYNREEFEDALLEHPSLLLEWFTPYQDQFLMKETTIAPFQLEEEGAEEEGTDEENESTEEIEEERIDVYEISFRGSDEQYKPLVEQHIQQMNVANNANAEIEEIMDTVEIERIDMTVFVDAETYDVHRLQTRFRYLAYIQGEYRVIDESVLLRFHEHNQEIDFETLKTN
ncbi:DUF6612 family protein [Alkalihalophilus pseudofirmus]|uniref:DUF6612 family protein n=1 Tax=Alkalihalophilus pseudofirmus TaxID=79885 RepID=A0AAJ2U3A9_ALKPS|nr:DUF6612 family protein [Alkalihalophilus pseudofirmus]MDV2886380.1 DUF6612 family protein [Alkalihalophilus pseudofirmus]